MDYEDLCKRLAYKLWQLQNVDVVSNFNFKDVLTVEVPSSFLVDYQLETEQMYDPSGILVSLVPPAARERRNKVDSLKRVLHNAFLDAVWGSDPEWSEEECEQLADSLLTMVEEKTRKFPY